MRRPLPGVDAGVVAREGPGLRRCAEDEIGDLALCDAATISGNDHLQDDLELDSMDILNLVIALNAGFGIAMRR